MITIRKSDARGHADHGWLNARHTFSFAGYFDPAHLGFGPLRVINEDRVAPGAGFPEHPHDNMEIITYIVSGALAHKDSTGSTGEIRPGDIQHMTAGEGVEHSEFNPSKTDPVHLLQIWIKPRSRGAPPVYNQQHFDAASRRDTLRLVASPDGRDGSIPIHADTRLYATLLGTGKTAALDLEPNHRAWVQLIKGGLTINGTPMAAGDGAAIAGEQRLEIAATADAEALVFDLA